MRTLFYQLMFLSLIISNYFLLIFCFIFMEQAEDQQWIVVTNTKQKHRGKIQNKIIHNKSSQKTYQNEQKQQYLQKFISSSAYNSNKKILKDVLSQMEQNCKGKFNTFHIECLGLGNFLDSKKSYYQLLFLTKLILPIINEIRSNKTEQKNEQKIVQLNIYDPAFSEKEKKLISQLKATQNQEFEFKKKALNIYFMPHCQRFLYEKVLQKYKINKKQENNSETKLIIIGNSIKQYIQRCQLLKQKVPQIFLQNCLKQQRISDFQDSLNDTFILFE